jgi:hypothetical protein
MQVYMIPLFLSLHWLNTVFSAEMLINRLGSPFLIDLTDKGWAIQGLNITAVFLITYIVALIGYHYGARKVQRKGVSHIMQPDIITNN